LYAVISGPLIGPDKWQLLSEIVLLGESKDKSDPLIDEKDVSFMEIIVEE
jgi:hypothetical protein